MSRPKLVSASLALLFTAAASAREPVYQPFPKGYGYLEPAEIRALQVAVRKADNAVVREHGWRLWAGIMQPAAGLDWQVWYTWPNTTNAFVAEGTLTNNIAASATSASPPKQRMGRLGASTLVPVDLPNTPDYNTIAAQVIKAYPHATDPKKCHGICDGTHFAFNGDIMIATESLSKETLDFIRDPKQPVYSKARSKPCTARSIRPSGCIRSMRRPAM